MKSLTVTVLLMLATAIQPMLALPASCEMPGKRPAMKCSSCCAMKVCCASSDRHQSSPLAAIVKSTGDLVPAVISQPVVVPLPGIRQIQHPTFARLSFDAHALSPLALNCIQLI